MAVPENADVMKMDSSGQSQDKNNVLEADTKPPCSDDHKSPESNSSVETSNPTKDQNSEGTLKSEISHLDVKFSKLNPMAKEYVPHSLAQAHSGFVSNMVWLNNMQTIPAVENGHFDTRVCKIYISSLCYGLYICWICYFSCNAFSMFDQNAYDSFFGFYIFSLRKRANYSKVLIKL